MTIAANGRPGPADLGKAAVSHGHKARATADRAAKASVGRGWDVAAPVPVGRA